MQYQEGAKTAAYQQDAAQCAAAPQTSSEAILSRLNSIRGYLAENRSSASHAADKVVGAAPTPIAGANGIAGGIAGIRGDHPPAACFIDALQQVIGDIENIMCDTQEHLGRLHRAF